MRQEDRPMTVSAVRVPIGFSGDTSGLDQALADGRLNPDTVVAVTGKTEGSGDPADTTRLEADRAIRRFLEEKGSGPSSALDDIPMVFTAGGIGIVSPHLVVYMRQPAEPSQLPESGAPRLVLGTARSAVIQPEWMGTTRVIEANVEAVRAAAAAAGIDALDAEYVVGKAYHPTQDVIAAARAAGNDIPEFEDLDLFRRTSGSAGLGVAVATEGIDLPSGDDVCRRLDLWAGRAAISANPWEPVAGGGPHTQVIVMGNRAGAGGNLRVGHGVLNDLLDIGALPRALRRAGMDVGNGPLTPEQSARIVAVYVKVGAGPEPLLRGRRQVTENPHYVNELKSAVTGMFSAWLQDNMIYLSAYATHQGPPGGGTVAVVVDDSAS